MPTDLPVGVTALTVAERSRRWRDARREAGLRSSGKSKHGGKSSRGGKKNSLFTMGEFVAIDGEGFSEGPELTFTVGQNNRIYTGKEHFYALLAASDGTELYASDGRLETRECLDFVLDIKRRNPRAIIVCFGGSYDITQFLAFGLSRDECAMLLKEPDGNDSGDKRRRKTLDVTLGEYDYRLELRPRKSLSIWRWKAGERKYERRYKKDGDFEWIMTNHDSAVVWDVWGFFQDSFVGVMDKWIPDHPDYKMIKREKGNRNIFERSEIDVIRTYNQAELRCLVEIMNMVRDAISTLGLQVTRWDGAGAIAAAMLKFHNVKDHKNETPPAVFLAARHAYSGGHIEVCRLGYHDGVVYHYDVNSAYPDQFRNLISLAKGCWKHGHGVPPDGFTVVKIAYEFHDGNNFYPLFYRENDGSILYPPRGCGWYWYPEFEAAREYTGRFGAKRFDVMEWWTFEPFETPLYPFHWIELYYEQRQSRVAAAKVRGVQDGPEKIIKLGLNSLYGKTAQQVGARPDNDGQMQPPAYFQLEWAGYVTSGCRAKLMQAAMQNPGSIIAFATDGLFATEPLDLDTPTEKILGAWEFDTHDGMTMVMPGVYWLHETGRKPKHYSRGFDKVQMSDAEFIHRAWKYRNDYVPIDITRLIGLGTACASDAFWQMRGMFVTGTRELALNGDNSKRYPVMLYREKPHLGLVATTPRDHFEDILTPLHELMSAPFEIAWLDKIVEHDPLGEMMEEWDAIDADLA
jgi:hypothetical protein